MPAAPPSRDRFCTQHAGILTYKCRRSPQRLPVTEAVKLAAESAVTVL
jgi:hypothetical protein